MAATLTFRVYTGSSAGTESGSVTGIDYISADNATNSLANRQANPIPVNSQSYEKWMKMKVDTAPANSVSNFQVWGDGTVMTSTTLMWTGAYVTGATPTNAVSTIANTTFTNFTSGNKMTWDSGSYTATNATTRYMVSQLQVAASAGPGNWTQETISVSWTET
jgi:hypothetical protein